MKIQENLGRNIKEMKVEVKSKSACCMKKSNDQ